MDVSGLGFAVAMANRFNVMNGRSVSAGRHSVRLSGYSLNHVLRRMMMAWTFSFYNAPIFYSKCVAAGKRETTQRISDRNRLMHFVRYIEFQTDSSRLLCVVLLQLYKALNIALYAARSYIGVLLDDAILILLNDLSRKIGLALQTSTWSKESSTLCICRFLFANKSFCCDVLFTLSPRLHLHEPI